MYCKELHQVNCINDVQFQMNIIAFTGILRKYSIISFIGLTAVFAFGKSEFHSSHYEKICDTGMAPVLGKHILTKTLHESVTSCAADCKKHPQCTAFDFNTNSVRTVCKTLKDDFRSNCAKNPQNGQHFRLVIGLFFALYLVL